MEETISKWRERSILCISINIFQITCISYMSIKIQKLPSVSMFHGHPSSYIARRYSHTYKEDKNT